MLQAERQGEKADDTVPSAVSMEDRIVAFHGRFLFR